MRVLITGNMGYVGPWAVRHLRARDPRGHIIGLDTGYFAHCLVGAPCLPECSVDEQRFRDVRGVTAGELRGVDVVVYLAAISNDPMGKTYEKVTMEVNADAAVSVARMAKAAGARRFVLASSCSVYGFVENGIADESSAVNPLTAYARSKVQAEQELATLATDDFVVTCFRFATACGMSERLRLDLVLNDFVASALATGRIQILSDGTPWRPLIHLNDMARALVWGAERSAAVGGPFLVLNAGSNAWNYQVRQLAEAVATSLPGVEISVNPNAAPDRRSYRVSFDLFSRLAPEAVPVVSLQDAVGDLVGGLRRAGFNDPSFRSSPLIRLNVLAELQASGLLSESLAWRFDRLPLAARFA